MIIIMMIMSLFLPGLLSYHLPASSVVWLLRTKFNPENGSQLYFLLSTPILALPCAAALSAPPLAGWLGVRHEVVVVLKYLLWCLLRAI